MLDPFAFEPVATCALRVRKGSFINHVTRDRGRGKSEKILRASGPRKGKMEHDAVKSKKRWSVTKERRGGVNFC